MAVPAGRTTGAGGSELTRLAARKFVESHGGGALGILAERAALAEERGHRVAARTWRELAENAAHILKSAHPGAVAADAAGWRVAVVSELHRPGRRV